jgi:hypothetical protein
MHIARDADNALFQPLRWTYGLVPIVAGIDKFTNLLTDWEAYLHPAARTLLPVDAGVLMRAIGVVEIVVGVLVLTRFTRVGAYLAAAWLALIAAQLVALGRFDIAVRDLVMAVGAWTLAQLASRRALIAETDDPIGASALEQAGVR